MTEALSPLEHQARRGGRMDAVHVIGTTCSLLRAGLGLGPAKGRGRAELREA